MKEELNHQLLDENPVANLSPGEIIIGQFEGLNDSGKPLVNFSYNQSTEPVVAISTVGLNQNHAGRQVALLFVENNIEQPVVIGLIHNQLNEILENFEISLPENKENTEPPNAATSKPVTVNDAYLDGKRVVIEGKEEVVLKCGEASITLTKAGKILIRGKYLLNRSSGVNRIMGGSVQVN